MMVGVTAAVAIPAFLRYIKRSKSSEATQNVGAIYRGAIAFYEAEHRGPGGKLQPKRTPAAGSWAPGASTSTTSWSSLPDAAL